MTIRAVGPFVTGFAVLVPAWALPMIVRSPGWPPELVLAVAVVWLQIAPGSGPPRTRLAGAAAGLVVVAVTMTPVVLALLALAVRPPRRLPAAAGLPPAAADEARRVRRLFRLATSGAATAEIRAYGLGPFLLAAHDRASAVVVRARLAAAAHSSWPDIQAGLGSAGIVLVVVSAAVWTHPGSMAVFAAAWASAVVAGSALG